MKRHHPAAMQQVEMERGQRGSTPTTEMFFEKNRQQTSTRDSIKKDKNLISCP